MKGFKRKDSQTGAVMIEAAYVLPVMVGVILFILETLSYALNSLSVNDALYDIHRTILDEVQECASADECSPTTYVKCDSDKVVLNSGLSTAIDSQVTSVLETRGIELQSTDAYPNGSAVTITPSTDTVTGFDIYVIRFQGVADSLVLPNILEEALELNVDTVISVKASCVTPGS